MALPAVAPISWKLPGSSMRSIRSRTVSRPPLCCRSTRSAPPISFASATRARISASSSSQPTGAVCCVRGKGESSGIGDVSCILQQTLWYVWWGCNVCQQTLKVPHGDRREPHGAPLRRNSCASRGVPLANSVALRGVLGGLRVEPDFPSCCIAQSAAHYRRARRSLRSCRTDRPGTPGADRAYHGACGGRPIRQSHPARRPGDQPPHGCRRPRR